MKKFIPYEKLSKKEQQHLNKMKRRTWGPLNPATRKPDNPRAYKRQKADRRNDDFPDLPFLY